MGLEGAGVMCVRVCMMRSAVCAADTTRQPQILFEVSGVSRHFAGQHQQSCLPVCLHILLHTADSQGQAGAPAMIVVHARAAYFPPQPHSSRTQPVAPNSFNLHTASHP